MIDGGYGQDTAVFAGPRSAYLIQADGSKILVSGPDGLDSLSNVEFLEFGDQTVAASDLAAASDGLVFLARPVSEAFNGGTGSDTVSYGLAAAAVKVDLTLTGPQPTKGSGSDQFSDIENLVGSNFSDKLKGDADANRLQGGDGADTLKGGDGDDVISGGNGDDSLTGNAGQDTLSYQDASGGVTVDLAVKTAQDTGGAGIDTVRGFENLRGSAFGDTLLGTKGANLIDGGEGDDIITGGLGGDTLTGGLGADQFVFTALADSAKKGAGRDQILDFSHAQGDQIDLSAIDADTAASGDQAFALVAAFNHHAGQLTATAQIGGGYLVEGDVDGNGKADFSIFLAADAPPTMGDFIL